MVCTWSCCLCEQDSGTNCASLVTSAGERQRSGWPGQVRLGQVMGLMVQVNYEAMDFS